MSNAALIYQVLMMCFDNIAIPIIIILLYILMYTCSGHAVVLQIAVPIVRTLCHVNSN